MQSEPRIGAPQMIVLSWTAAIAAYPAVVMSAIVGQGLGAVAGGCHWIGFSLNLDRQVWALVNQPVLNFSSLPAATGYWLGSLFVPVLLAVALIPLLPHKRRMTIELILIQTSWAAASVGIAWLSLVDRTDGHLIRWLGLHDLPLDSVWLAPIAASFAGLIPTTRLMALARRGRPDTGRLHRLYLTFAHFGIPVFVWVGAAALLGKTIPLRATSAIAIPLCASFALAWFRYPRPYAHRTTGPSRSELALVLAAATLCAVATTVVSLPRTDGRSPGYLWGTPQASNNIRPWIEPISLRSGRDSNRAP